MQSRIASNGECVKESGEISGTVVVSSKPQEGPEKCSPTEQSGQVSGRRENEDFDDLWSRQKAGRQHRIRLRTIEGGNDGGVEFVLLHKAMGGYHTPPVYLCPRKL